MMRKQICRDHVFGLHLEAPTSTAGGGIIDASKGGSLLATVHQTQLCGSWLDFGIAVT
jgi:hypothetical protein